MCSASAAPHCPWMRMCFRFRRNPLEEQAVLEAQKQALLAAVESMKEPDREIFLRYYYYFETMEEIALRLEMPVGTVKAKLHRGRKRLKDTLTEQEVSI